MSNGEPRAQLTTHVGRETSRSAQISQERRSPPHATKEVAFTPADLHQSLYRRNEVVLISKDDLKISLQHREQIESYWCKGCQQEKAAICQIHGPHQVLKIARTANNDNNTDANFQFPYAVQSFPCEVGLCKSGIPGADYGVCARQHVPIGTWIGPYEGVKVRPDQVSLGTDASYMWEIYHEGNLLYYIDGRDENKASWMRYIRCARHGGEQNMFAFQYYGNIYYRAFRDITPGEELLVWYDEKYPQYMGIPLEIRESCIGSPIDLRQHAEMTVSIPRENSQESVQARPPSSSSLVDDRLFPNFQSVSVKPSMSTHHRLHNRSDAVSRVKRRTSQSTSVGSSASLTDVDYDPVCHVSRTYVETDARFSSPVIRGYQSSEYISCEPENQGDSFETGRSVVQNITIGSFHNVTGNHSDEPKGELFPAAESQFRSGDEEENSSDGSDASFFNCGQCGKSFAQQSVLQIHVCPNRPHKPYHCGQCTQSFDYPSELRMHAITHAGDKPFKCGYCSRSFAGATTLHNHVRTHTGEKPFTCQRCGKMFTQASQLHKHKGIPGDCVP